MVYPTGRGDEPQFDPPEDTRRGTAIGFGRRNYAQAASSEQLRIQAADRLNPWPLSAARPEPPRETARPNEPAYAQPQPQPYAQAAEPAPSKGRKASGAVVYSLIGFIAGAVFWHAVGFWSFVHHAVFSGPRQETAIAATPAPGYPAAPDTPVITYDEQQLRSFSRRPAIPEAERGGAAITTGTIARPSPRQRAIQPQEAVEGGLHTDVVEPAASLPFGETSWQPAVKKAP